jgi:hypothetical protein
MPNIIDLSYFQKANALNIPLSVQMILANPTLETPNSATALTELIMKVEKSVLLNALGLTTYNELQLAIADEFTNPLYAKYQKLVEGEEYDGKKWQGLNYEYSLIAWKIYQDFIFNTNQQLTGIGNVEVKPQGANLVTPVYKIANANANFIQQYQGGYMKYPIIYNDGEFIDWFSCNNEIEVSLYRYLTDKKADFTDVNLESFRVYETYNSFGI